MRNWMLIMTSTRLCFLLLAVLVAAAATQSAVLRDVPQTLVQPDGSVVQCFASGDEFHHWLHDARNYTIVQDPANGAYVYAVTAKGTLVPTPYVVGTVDPASVGLQPGANIPASVMEARRRSSLAGRGRGAMTAGTTGTLNNIVIFIRFADEPAGVFPEVIGTYDDLFNSGMPGMNSLFRYYREVSYGQLIVQTTFYPSTSGNVISYVDDHPRNYYRKYDAVTNPTGYTAGEGSWMREQTMLAKAIRAVSAQIPANLVIDANNDGYVDNICFILSGGAEGWSDLLWPHMTSLTIERIPINGKVVGNYNLQLRSSLLSTGNLVYVLAHELFHSLGAPDLYHYSGAGPDPVGGWDIMNYGGNPPAHMSAHMKWKYGGWISAMPTITSPGMYSLLPLVQPTRNCYRIPSLYSKKEYFVVEYRKAEGAFERSLPGSGLLVYRVNTERTGNADGPPDELYLFRPGGSPGVTGSPTRAAMSADAGRTTLSDSTSPSSFLTDGSPGGLVLRDVGLIGDSITFRVEFPAVPVLTLSARAIYLDPVSDAIDRIDTSVVVRNTGYGPDSVTVTLGSGGALADSAIVVQPAAFALAQGDSQRVGITIRPRLLAPGYYAPAVRITSRFGMDPRVFSVVLDFERVLAVTEARSGLPAAFTLDQNSPNPFNPSTMITYAIPVRAHVTLTVFNALGQQVAVITSGVQDAGYHVVRFEAHGLPSGVYFYRMQARGTEAGAGPGAGGRAGWFQETKKLMLLR